MQYRTLGRTGLKVSAVSLGGLFFGKLDGGRDVSKTLSAAVDTGMNLIDTAIGYEGSEEALGKALKAGGWRDKFLLATKWYPYTKESHVNPDPAALRKAVEGSLSRLQTGTLDLFMYHYVSHAGDVKRLTEAPMLEEMARLKREGKVRFTGVSHGEDPEAKRLVEAVESGAFDFIMPSFLVLNQQAWPCIPAAAAANVGVISIMPLGQAAWGFGLRDRATLKASIEAGIKKGQFKATDFPDPEKALDFLLDGTTTSVAQAGLRWCLSFPEISTVCCGTNDPAHILENAAVVDQGPYDAGRMKEARRLFGPTSA